MTNIPYVGLGTLSILQSNVDVEYFILKALEFGYRKFDISYIKDNTQTISFINKFSFALHNAINRDLVKREDLYISVCIHQQSFANDDIKDVIKQLLYKLELTYVDCVIIHDMLENSDELAKVLVNEKQLGNIKEIGLANCYNYLMFARFQLKNSFYANVVQNEFHIFTKKERCAKNTRFECYYPLGGINFNKIHISNNHITNIAKKHNKTSAQIILKWHIQNDRYVIPSTINIEHLKQNIDIFNFQLDNDDLILIDNIHNNKSIIYNDVY